MESQDLRNVDASDLSTLSPAQQQDLARFVNLENQRAMMQERIHHLTNKCFKKCIASTTPSSQDEPTKSSSWGFGRTASRSKASELSSTEESCVQNCVLRFMDAQALTIAHLKAGGGEMMALRPASG